MRLQTLALLTLGLLAGSPARSEPPAGCPNQFEYDVVQLVNQQRLAAGTGLRPLTIDTRLVAAAQRHSDDMAARSFFSHTGSDGSTFVVRIDAAGYLPWSFVGENIAAGQTTPAAVVAAWMGSPGHRANILSPDFDHIGVGYAANPAATYRHYWTQDFGRTSSALHAPKDLCGPECSDGIDDDGDGKTDYPADTQCLAASGISENPALACGLGFEQVVILPALLRLRRRSETRHG